MGATGSNEQRKTAGALVYLTEELGDARLRCDQLLRYVDRATKLIEKSSHKDHFFEVAGDLIRGIPETSFKLHKALQAVALAANRIDYEEIKQDLRPEKVEELERVLKDVRVRQVQRRSLPMVNPGNVVQQLKGLAKQARTSGHLDTERLGALIAALEVGAPKVAADTGAKVADQLDAMVHALENPPRGEMPSRVRLAQVLRKAFAQHVDLTGLSPRATRIAGNVAPALELDASGSKTASDDEKRSRHEEGKSVDPTKNMSEEDAKEWKANTEKHKDNFKAAFEEDSEEDSDDHKGTDKTAFAELEPQDPEEVTRVLAQMLDAARKGVARDGDYKKVLFQAIRVLNGVYGLGLQFSVPSIGLLVRIQKELMQFAGVHPQTTYASLDEDKVSRHEEGKSVDPTKNMSEEDAKEWKANTEKHKDNFKSASGKIPAPDGSVIEEIMSWHGGQGSRLYSVGSMWNAGHEVDADDAEEAYDDLKRHKADRHALAEFKAHLKEHGVKVASAGKNSWKAA